MPKPSLFDLGGVGRLEAVQGCGKAYLPSLKTLKIKSRDTLKVVSYLISACPVLQKLIFNSTSMPKGLSQTDTLGLYLTLLESLIFDDVYNHV